MAVQLPGGLSIGGDCPPENSIGIERRGNAGASSRSLCSLELLFSNFSVVNVDMGFMGRKYLQEGKIWSF